MINLFNLIICQKTTQQNSKKKGTKEEEKTKEVSATTTGGEGVCVRTYIHTTATSKREGGEV